MKRLLFVLCAAALWSCASDNVSEEDVPGGGGGGGSDSYKVDGKTASCWIDTAIPTYNGETASDYSQDVVGTDEDLYWELTEVKAKNTIDIVFDGDKATVTNPNTTDNTVVCDGAHVKVTLGKKSRINLSGSSSDGSVRIYSANPDDESKFILSMNSLSLTSARGPALNSQVGKRMYVILSGTSSLQDAETYSDDVEGEDSKGCLFSEGNQIWSGDGVLRIKGNRKNAIATDGYFYMRPGPTVVIEDAASNGIKVKGDSDLDDMGDEYGIYIAGGMIWASVSSESGKCLSTDSNFRMTGGSLVLSTKGSAVWDEDEQDTSSPSCVKADLDMNVHGGTLQLRSSGKGGKGVSVDGNFNMYGGTLTASATGDQFVHGQEDADPKAMKVEGDITVSGGTLNLCSLGRNDGAEAMESKSSIKVDGGNVYAFAYDDAVNAAENFTVNGGHVYAYSQANDAIDSNGNICLNGGMTYAFALSNEAAFDNDNPGAQSVFEINGGVVVGVSGTCYKPSSSSSQNTVIAYGISSNMDATVALLDSAGDPSASFSYSSSRSGASVLISVPDLKQGSSYSISRGGTLSEPEESFYGLNYGGTYSDGTSLYSFSQSGRTVTVGNESQGGGGGPRF